MQKHHNLNVVCTYDCLIGISNIMSVLNYDGPWQSRDIARFTRCSFSLMQWGCVSYQGVGELIIVDGTMKSTDYIDIMDQNLQIPLGICLRMP